MVRSSRSKFFPVRMDPIFKRESKGIVTSLESVSIILGTSGSMLKPGPYGLRLATPQETFTCTLAWLDKDCLHVSMVR